MKEMILKLLEQTIGEDTLYFDTALVIKSSPHTLPVNIWGVCKKGNRIALMNNRLEWFEIEEKDNHYPLVLSTLYQRIKTIEQKLKTA